MLRPVSLSVLLAAALGLACAEAADSPEEMAQAQALYRAADKGDVAQVRALAGNPPDQDLLSSLLYHAIEDDDFKAFTTLLDAGADGAYLRKNADGGRPAIHNAASPAVARTPRYLEELLRRGYDVNSRDRSGETPLHQAVGLTSDPFLQIKLVDVLLAAGADIHARDKAGETVLFHATLGHNPHRDWVMFFLEKGVDARAIDDLGYTFQYGYLYGGNSDSELLGADGKRRREKARKWLGERGIPLENRTMPMTPLERLEESATAILPDAAGDITLDGNALQAYRLSDADAAAAMQATHTLPTLKPASDRIWKAAEGLAAAFPEEVRDVASRFYYGQYMIYQNDATNIHTLGGALGLYTVANLTAQRAAFPGDETFNRDYYAAALQFDRYLAAHPPQLAGEALETAYLQWIMLGLHNAVATYLAAPDKSAAIQASGARNLRSLYGEAAAHLDSDAKGIKLSK